MFNKDLIKNIFIYSFRFKRHLLRQPRIPILFYHQICDGGLIARNQRSCISTKRFKQQMEFLFNSGYQTLTLYDICDWIDGNKKLPKKAVCITLDDGHRDNYYHAFPILKKYGHTANIFIVPAQMGKELWYSRKKKKWERAYDDNDDLYFEFLNWDQVKEMANYGISFQSHTNTHPYLTELSASEVKEELKNSKMILEERLNKPVKFLAYPYGDYNDSVIEAVKKCGYKAAVTVDCGHVRKNAYKYSLKRQYVLNHGGIVDFQMNLHNLDEIYDKLSNSFKSILK